MTRGQGALVYDDDLPAVTEHRWWPHTNGYAITNGPNHRVVYMHRLIVGAVAGQEVDHVNGDKLDNRRRANLRFATRGQQMQNQAVRRDNRLGYRGVSKSRYGRFHARLGAGSAFWLGTFDTAEEAARAYDAAALATYGEFARLNFPQERAS